MRLLAATAAAAAVAAPLASGFYLPGVAPTNFVEGQRVELKVSGGHACFVVAGVCVCRGGYVHVLRRMMSVPVCGVV